MKIDAEKLLECIGQVGDDLVMESETATLRGTQGKARWAGWLSMAAAFVLGMGVVGLYFLLPNNNEANESMHFDALPAPAAAMPPMATPAPDDMATWGAGAGEAVPEAYNAPAPMPATPFIAIPDAPCHLSCLPLLVLREIIFPYNDEAQTISPAEFQLRTTSLERSGAVEWAEALPVYRRMEDCTGETDDNRILIGYYPLYTPEEATQRLLDAYFFTTVLTPHLPTEETVLHTELVYITENQSVFMPFFRFYVEIEGNMLGIYYVIAVREDYISPYCL
jgi:hypothetical protein